MLSVLSYFTSLFRRHRFKVLFIVFATIITESIWSTLIPYATKQLIDILSQAGSGDVTQTQLLLQGAILRLLGLSIFAWVVNRFLQYTNTTFQTSVMAHIEQTSTAYVLGHSAQFFQDTFAGSLVRRVTRLARSFEETVDITLQKLIPALVAFCGIQFVVWQRNPTIGIALMMWLLALVIYNVWYGRFRTQTDLERSLQDSKLSGFLADIFSNSATVKSFAQELSEQKSLRNISETLRAMRKRTWALHDWSHAGQTLTMYGMQAGALIYGSHLWARGEITAGDLLLFHTYFMILNNKMQDVARLIRQYFSAFTDAKEMVDILNEPHLIQDAPRAKKLRVKSGDIVFDNVDFYYGQSALLKKFSMHVRAGERVALVGPSGAGKSTIIKLIMRYHDIERGNISIDGQNIAHVTQESLRSQIAVVPQESVLFHRSIKDNIRYGNRRASDAEVIRAGKSARCHEFIMQLPEGYDTYVGERGVKLSGGERQRVAIARAILKDAPILVLDEATSSLDSESEKLIQDALAELMKKRTVIVIAHRLSTIMSMDRILVVQHGKIVDEGTHEDLLTNGGLYKHLWDIQAGSFA